MEKLKITHKYDDIINLPHHTSKKHPRMSSYDRAAQFSPFSALTGHDEALKETGRLTDSEITMDEYVVAELNEKLRCIGENLASKMTVTITYFKPDDKKSGGAYLTVTGNVRKIDEYERTVVLEDRTVIPIEHIIGIECE